MYIAIDFDGTCVSHEFPEIGKNIGAEIVLKALAEEGHKIILYTMRSHPSQKTKEAGKVGMISTERDTLQEAVNWFEKNSVPLFGINENPTQHSWTDSPKPYAHIYIDDAALGVPLISSAITGFSRNCVNWFAVTNLLYGYPKVLSEEKVNQIVKELEDRYPNLYRRVSEDSNPLNW